MSEYLFQYRGIDPTTWVYLSSLLLIGLFFKFGRVWSVRNLDLILLILLGPGLLIIYQAQTGLGELNVRMANAAAENSASTSATSLPTRPAR